MSEKLNELCADPTRTGRSDIKEQPSNRKQLTKLRNEMRATLANVNKKIEEEEAAGDVGDPLIEAAKADAMERMKRPVHLRGSAVLAAMGSAPKPH